jgi:hypothetical protein
MDFPRPVGRGTAGLPRVGRLLCQQVGAARAPCRGARGAQREQRATDRNLPGSHGHWSLGPPARDVGSRSHGPGRGCSLGDRMGSRDQPGDGARGGSPGTCGWCLVNGARKSGWVALALTPMVPWLGSIPGVAWAVPCLAPLTVWPLFRRAVLSERQGSPLAATLLWACLYSIGVVGMVQLAPELAERAILHGEVYRAEMFSWILTGHGQRWIRTFLPIHAAHLGAFCSCRSPVVVTGLALGACLVGYMRLLSSGASPRRSGAPGRGSPRGRKVPWSVLRVVSYVLLESWPPSLLLRQPSRSDPSSSGWDSWRSAACSWTRSSRQSGPWPTGTSLRAGSHEREEGEATLAR